MQNHSLFECASFLAGIQMLVRFHSTLTGKSSGCWGAADKGSRNKGRWIWEFLSLLWCCKSELNCKGTKAKPLLAYGEYPIGRGNHGVIHIL